MKIGILGGAFDPIHIDHLKTVKAVLDAGLVERVWISPCWNHRFGKDLQSAHDRIEMIRLAIKEFGDDRISCNTYECDERHNGSTYEYLKQMQRYKRNGDEYFYITGLDNANIITRWHNWLNLIKEFSFIIVSRGDYVPSKHAWFIGSSQHYYLDLGEKVGKMSSTQIREQIKDSSNITGTFPSVIEYIKKKNLYAKIPF